MLTRKYILLSACFILTPPLGAGVLVWLAKSRSVDTQAAALSHLFWPGIAATFIAAFIGWAIFLRPPKNYSDGKKAGLVTVFLCYFLGIIPIAIIGGSWDGLSGVISVYLTVFLLAQIVTFWVTYPIGAFFGRWIAKRML